MRQNCCMYVLWFVLVAVAATMAQSYPQIEVAGGYSYMNFHASVPQLTSQSFNGGGAAVVYNLTNWLGIKADFTGYAFGSGWTHKLQELGYIGSASANMFTYQFGPQIKKHSGKLQPFAQTLYGIAHSNGYAAVLQAKGNGSYVLTSGGSDNAFAMEIGGGLDIPLSRTIQIRPVELDYQLTRFGFQNFSANQNNFKYFAGVNFTFGEK
ncbi:MAG: hypothetical protein ACLP3R_09910 [Candidatus Korobacteraceae bacterium]